MSIRNLCLAAVVVLLCGCSASVKDVQVYSGTLQPGDGVLVVVVDTMVPFDDLRLTRPNDTFAAIVARDVPRGRTIRFIELPAGTYSWVRVDLRNGTYVPLDRKKKERYQFTVKPGVVNYPGDFMLNVVDNEFTRQILESGNPNLLRFINSYYIQLTDRTAMMLGGLNQDQEDMVRKLTLSYGGPGSDDFPQYYQALVAKAGKP